MKKILIIFSLIFSSSQAFAMSNCVDANGNSYPPGTCLAKANGVVYQCAGNGDWMLVHDCFYKTRETGVLTLIPESQGTDAEPINPEDLQVEEQKTEDGTAFEEPQIIRLEK